jgi:hypothetical protein
MKKYVGLNFVLMFLEEVYRAELFIFERYFRLLTYSFVESEQTLLNNDYLWFILVSQLTLFAA